MTGRPDPVVERAGAVAQMSRALAQVARDPEQVIARATAELCRLVGDACGFFVADASGFLTPVRTEFRDAEVERLWSASARPRLQHVDDPGPTADAFRTGRSVLVRDVDNDALIASIPDRAEFLTRFPLRSLVSVPVWATNHVIGVLNLSRFALPGRAAAAYDDADVLLLEDLAGRIGLALENARLFVELRASEEMFRSSFEGTPVGTVLISLAPATHGRLVRVNPTFASLVGGDVAELTGASFSGLAHPDDVAAIEVALAAMAAGDRAELLLERRLLRGAGGPIVAKISGSVLRGADGEPVHAVTHVEDVTQQHQAAERLIWQALHDPLTELPNRQMITEQLRILLGGGRPDGGAVGVILLDLDRFKNVNDSVGHVAGDEVLLEVSRRLQAAIRPGDTLGRLGGDEFAIICPYLRSIEEVQAIAGNVRASLEAPIAVDDTQVTMTASLGIASAFGSTTDPYLLLRQADTAMYRAKERGRDRHQLYDEIMYRLARDRVHAEADLRDALEHGWIRVYFQPILDLTSNRLRGAEALVRIEHPDQGLILPARFIGVAEETGLIVPLGALVLEDACRRCAQWQRRLPEFRMHVNLSARQIADDRIRETIAGAVAQSGIDPDSLVLELTETSLTQADRATLNTLRRIRELGVHLAIDDFGTGYSSLAALRDFPFDGLKIDRAFVANLDSDQDRAIVRAIQALAATLNLDLVAEGIESELQATTLVRLGCEMGQGFWYSEPVPADVFGATWHVVPAAG